MCKLNAFDTTSTTEKAFRIKVVNRILPTLDIVKNVYNLTNNDTCHRCKKEQETLEHLWNCEITKDQMPELITDFNERLKTRIDETTDYKMLSKSEYRPTIDELSSLIQIENESFLDSTLSKGIVHKQYVNEMRQTTSIKENKNIWFQYALDCWLSTFYHNIWKKRNDLTIPKDYWLQKRKRDRANKRKKTNKRPPPLKETPDGNYYEVEEILDTRINPDTHKRQYLIHWKGYDRPTDHTWKDEDKMTGLENLLRKFNQTHQPETSITTPNRLPKRSMRITQSPHKRRRITNTFRRSETPETQDPQIQEEQQDEYEIEKIVNHYYDRKAKEYQYEVKWKGYNEDDNLWLHEKDLTNANELISDYRKMKKSRKRISDEQEYDETKIKRKKPK